MADDQMPPLVDAIAAEDLAVVPPAKKQHPHHSWGKNYPRRALSRSIKELSRKLQPKSECASLPPSLRFTKSAARLSLPKRPHPPAPILPAPSSHPPSPDKLTKKATTLLASLTADLAHLIIAHIPDTGELTLSCGALRWAVLQALPPALGAAAAQGGEAAAAMYTSTKAADAAKVAAALAAVGASTVEGAVAKLIAAEAAAGVQHPGPHDAWYQRYRLWQQFRTPQRTTMFRAGTTFSLSAVRFILSKCISGHFAAATPAFLCGALEAVLVKVLGLVGKRPKGKPVQTHHILQAMAKDSELHSLLSPAASSAAAAATP
jgi:hypothetical protein